MNQRRGDACAATSNGKTYVVGGFTEDNWCQPLASFEVYDAVTNTWTTLPDIAGARGDAACGMESDRFYVVGGESKNASDSECAIRSEVIFNLTIYIPAENRWYEDGRLPAEIYRFEHQQIFGFSASISF
jgi:hypothetical protein